MLNSAEQRNANAEGSGQTHASPPRVKLARSGPGLKFPPKRFQLDSNPGKDFLAPENW